MEAKTLESIRIAAGKSRAEAARALGVKQSTYWRKEKGKRRLTVDEAAILAQLFGVSVEEIVLACRGCAETAKEVPRGA